MILYYEISPLGEHDFTGIAQVTAEIAAQMLGDVTNDIRFFYGRQHIDSAMVEQLLLRRNGELLKWHLGRANATLVPLVVAEPSIAIFSNVKTVRRAFDYEVQVIYDLSALLTPQFHNQDTINFHGLSFRGDLATNDLTVCISEATRTDVVRYLKPPRPETVIAIPLGHAWSDYYEAAHHAFLNDRKLLDSQVEPYILILGTIEPRKNIGAVMEYLERAPRALDYFRFVFVGRHGWGEEFSAYLQRYNLINAYEQQRILFTGFVSEQCKYSLMKEAKLVVYPSLFEGFGLPVLEAMSLGVPVLTTRSSSIPEVAGDACFYFDPFVEAGFDSGFAHAMGELRANEESVRSRARARSRQFSWPTFYQRLLAAIATATGDATA
jgi:glycosyltransferase involved in cell wall biosynthesis